MLFTTGLRISTQENTCHNAVQNIFRKTEKYKPGILPVQMGIYLLYVRHTRQKLNSLSMTKEEPVPSIPYPAMNNKGTGSVCPS
jgi:hypothetical protein